MELFATVTDMNKATWGNNTYALMCTACSIEGWPGAVVLPVSAGQYIRVHTAYATNFFKYYLTYPAKP
jgi:hypothetical protein